MASLLPRNTAPADPLDAQVLRATLAACGHPMEVEVLQSCTSTNALLLAAEGVHTCALLAERQTAGRGRRGRRWHAAPGADLTFSLRRRFDFAPSRLAGLSLAVGAGLARTLRALGAHEAALKWPNDLVAREAKLAGVLVETRAGSRGVTAVVGVGLNLRTNPGAETRLGRPVIALDALLGTLPGRNALAAALLAGLEDTLDTFGREGLDAFISDWQSMHALQGRRLRVRMADGRVIAGTADGIAADGGLLVRNRGGVHAIHSGSVVRPRAGAGRAAT